MAKSIILRRKPRHRRRFVFFPVEVTSTVGSSRATTTVKGLAGSIGTAIGYSSVLAQANDAVGTVTTSTVVSGVMNAAASVGTAPTSVLVAGIVNAPSAIGTVQSNTIVTGISGSLGTAVGTTVVSGAMATYVDEIGNLTAFMGRLISLMPPSWFEYSNETTLSIPISGMAYGLLWIYILYLYVIQQSRIQTATGVWLDRIAYDFFGPNLPRLLSETDAAYSERIRATIVEQRQTRSAITKSADFLTGFEPTIIELWNPGDVGCYNITASNGICTQGYGVAGMYGSLQFRNQFLVNAFRPQGEGIVNVPGYGVTVWGYGTLSNPGVNEGGGEYCDIDQINAQVLDSDIYANIAGMIGAGNTAWTVILTHPDTVDAPTAYFGNVNNSSYAVLFGGGFFF